MKAIERTGIDYYCQVTDVELIQEIIRGLPDNPFCVNIGAGMGTSALAMLEARPDSEVASIDIKWSWDEWNLLEENNLSQDEGRYWQFTAKSQEFGLDWKPETADFVFIDGGHTYQECLEDALVWYKALKNNGIMAFHDYESPIQILESVKRAVDDVVKVLQLEFVTKRGTLIVFRKVENG